MTVDYDLIVLGGAPIGRYAALKACNLGARVALIEPLASASASALPDYLSQLNRRLKAPWDQATAAEGQPDWAQIRRRAEQISQRLAASIAVPDSLPQLMTAGVEVILAEATFQRPNPRLRLGVAVDQRLLRARSYLLAPGLATAQPDLPGLAPVTLWPDWETLPARIVILGDDPQRIWLAQVLNRLGVQVRLVGGAFLPQADPQAERLLQLQLEAEGVTVLTGALVRQIQQLGSQTSVQLDNQTLETDAVLLANSRLALEKLNLMAAGVKWQDDRILVNRRLQTSQPRIYACHPSDSLAAADLALHHALGFPAKQRSLQRIWSLPTDPELVGLGLTEPQAVQRYGNAVRIGSQPLKNLASAQMQGETTGFVKLIAHSNGQILGAHAVGSGASNWMGEVALAMQQNLKLSALAHAPALSPVSALIREMAIQMQSQQRPNWRKELLETWFDFRRSR